MTITEFLLARIAEDEAVANSTVNLTSRDGWWVDGPSLKSSKYWVYATGENFTDRSLAEHIARHDPARVLAECEAKRRIIEDLDGYCWGDNGDKPCGDCERIGCRNLRWMAWPYADHPDYQQEWRP